MAQTSPSISRSAPPSVGAQSSRESSPAELESDIRVLRERALAFARLAPAEKAKLLRGLLPRLDRLAAAWVEAGCRAKGIAPDSPMAGEEWLAGPMTTARNIRLLAESLDEIASGGRPRLGSRARTRPDGRVEIDVFPARPIDHVVGSGLSCSVLVQAGIDERAVREQQARFYQQERPEGHVALVLGAGNVSSIPPMDALYMMFVEGSTCLLKMNPVNEWVGPILAQIFAPLVEQGYFRIAYGGGEVGAALVAHDHVDCIHITGSDRTYDLIVWGPEGPERDRRKRQNLPVLNKQITAELGNVSPVMVAPDAYTDDELWFQARNVTTMVVNNGSFNCNAAKILVLPKGWAQRDKFLGMLEKALGSVAPRLAYYPGARQRYDELLRGREVTRFGADAGSSRAGGDFLPWALVRGLDPADGAEPLFRVEPFCGILSVTELGSDDPLDFLPAAVHFCNERLWGTLNAALVVRDASASDPTLNAALDRAVLDLRYGTVAINHWPATGYAMVNPPWGGHPSASPADIQSGLGWVHNSFMLEGIEKSVVRGPVKTAIKPAWFYDNKSCRDLGEKVTRLEASPHWWKLPGLAMAGLRG